MKLKDKYKRNPFSSNLKRSIEVETWFDKPKILGYIEIDLVHHSGASGKGDFLYTLTATEINTGWTELRVLKNKAMIWTKEALKNIIESMPMKVEKIHSDNGSEFINA
ncbi:MAG: integrase catalytic domain-containing protein, partial [bacterium]